MLRQAGRGAGKVTGGQPDAQGGKADRPLQLEERPDELFPQVRLRACSSFRVQMVVRLSATLPSIAEMVGGCHRPGICSPGEGSFRARAASVAAECSVSAMPFTRAADDARQAFPRATTRQIGSSSRAPAPGLLQAFQPPTISCARPTAAAAEPAIAEAHFKTRDARSGASEAGPVQCKRLSAGETPSSAPPTDFGRCRKWAKRPSAARVSVVPRLWLHCPVPKRRELEIRRTSRD